MLYALPSIHYYLMLITLALHLTNLSLPSSVWCSSYHTLPVPPLSWPPPDLPILPQCLQFQCSSIPLTSHSIIFHTPFLPHFSPVFSHLSHIFHHLLFLLHVLLYVAFIFITNRKWSDVTHPFPLLPPLPCHIQCVFHQLFNPWPHDQSCF